MELKNKQLVFCFPYRGAGGVNMLFLRLANYLSERGYDVALVDYLDGDMSRNNDKKIKVIPYFDDQKVYLPKTSVIIFQSMTPWSIFPMLEIDDESHVFFITTLPANFYPLLPGIFRKLMSGGGWFAKFVWKTVLISEYIKSKKFLDLITDQNSHVFLDSDIVCNIEKSLNVSFDNPKYLPLFSQDALKNEYIGRNKKDDCITLGWVGRLADFKISILNRVVDDAYSYANLRKKRINFLVVGNGKYEDDFKEKSSDFFKITKIDYISPENLDDFMLSLDMLFAMGTSALDGVKLGVPTVRLDYSYSKIPIFYRYKFFYEIQGFCLGENISGGCFCNGMHLFSDLIHMLDVDRELLSKKSYDFYRENHSISNSSALFLTHIKESNLVWRDLKNKRVLTSFLYSLSKVFKGQSNV